jgi:hypothetical protein
MRIMDQARRCRVFLLLVSVGCGRTALDAVAAAGGSGVLKSGGVVSSGGTGGTGGTTGGSVWGMACTGDQDCQADGICCDGSNQSCDVTRLPTGDSNNPGELAYAGDDITVRDTITGLTWQRDVLGKPSGCSGSNGGCTWNEAKAYCASLTLGGVSGWRLPGRMELLTIADHTRAPALDPRAFPITPDDINFWTSSPLVGTPGWVWDVSFVLGTPSIEDGAVYNKVRCVHGARCVPKTRFAVLDGGLVQDKLTGLVWQQQISQIDLTWADALSYCPTLGPGFRLATVKELASLMDLGVASPGPTVDTTAFPNIPTIAGAAFWASTPYVISPGAAWMVFFGNAASAIEDTSFRFRAWCVSGGGS